MPDLTLILLAAGDATRFRQDHYIKKQWIYSKDTPLWLYVAKRFKSFYEFKKIIIVAKENEINYMRYFCDEFIYVKGGKERQESLKNALKEVDTSYVLVSDVARACVPKEMVLDIIKNYNKADCIVPFISVSDTAMLDDTLVDRNKLKLIQTPQLSKTNVLKEALNQDKIFTDESSAIRSINKNVFYIKGSKEAKKITYFDDLKELWCLKKPKEEIFSGFGFDVHPFIDNKPMYLCGVKIDVPYGFLAHSDGDVAIHALIDSLLGAIGAGDIGELFPDSDKKYKDIDSKILLKEVVEFINEVGYKIQNCDITIAAQQPRLKEYKQKMRKTLAKILKIDPVRVNIKATTTEKLGFIGRKEGVGVFAQTTLKIYNWQD